MAFEFSKADIKERNEAVEAPKQKLMSTPLKAVCMVCGKHKDCVRCIDIGWVCLYCYRDSEIKL